MPKSLIIVSLILALYFISCTKKGSEETNSQYYSDRDGYQVFEDDILLPSVTTSEIRGAVAGVEDGNFKLWPSNKIPYLIDASITDSSLIKKALFEFENQLPLRFIPKTNETDYVVFKRASGICASFIGLKGGPQEILVSTTCTKSNLLHELGHAAGLWHEQTRADRDDYIYIRWENIIPGMEFNFKNNKDFGNKLTRSRRDVGIYDIESIMHSDAYAFSKNGQSTISGKDGVALPTRSSFSKGDKDALARLYSPQIKKLLEYSPSAKAIFYTGESASSSDGLYKSFSVGFIGLPITPLIPQFTIPQESWTSEHFIFTQSSNGEFYAVNTAAHQVYKVSLSGELEKITPSDTEFSWPLGITFDYKRKEINVFTSHVMSYLFTYSLDSKVWTRKIQFSRLEPSFAPVDYADKSDSYYAFNSEETTRAEPGKITSISHIEKEGTVISRLILDSPIPLLNRYPSSYVQQMKVILDPITQKEVVFHIMNYAGNEYSGNEHQFKIFRIDDPGSAPKVTDVTSQYWNH